MVVLLYRGPTSVSVFLILLVQAQGFTPPFVEDTLLTVKRLMGENFWSYSIADNAKVLEAFCEMHHRQGLSPRRLAVDELFHPATFETYSL